MSRRAPPEGAAEDSIDVGAAMLDGPAAGPTRDHVILQDARATYAIRMGDWKLIERVDPPAFEPRNRNAARRLAAARRGAPGRDELYNLADDPAEATDVSADHPEVVARLREALDAARSRGRTR